MIGVIGLLVACATSPSSTPSSTPAAAPNAAQTRTNAQPSAPTVDPETSECIETCKRNQMARAVAIEVIEADCAKACSDDDPIPTLSPN